VNTAYKKIQLGVASYKQYDPRWGNMYIGSSGRTVKSIGCTVNCVAMAETYRNGYNITPADIVSSSKFTSGGAYYWPGHYSKDYSSDYLSVIYRKLSEGKPVIFHSNASGGSSHWVIVTGFTGGNTLSADKFIINDPGSAVRTTLADHLKYYPNYSKLVYYS
nr:C39 family peptidase [Clostridia bacterium]